MQTYRLPLGLEHTRHKGEALFPEREPFETLEEIRREIGPYAFGSQYQQDPVPPDGATIRWEWFGIYGERPVAERAAARGPKLGHRAFT